MGWTAISFREESTSHGSSQNRRVQPLRKRHRVPRRTISATWIKLRQLEEEAWFAFGLQRPFQPHTYEV